MWLFPTAIFLGAFLFFDLQLISTKQILPWFGGAAAVWTTALLFYQALLLGGYAYAHALTTRLPARAQRAVHLALIAIAALLVGACAWRWGSPLTPSASWRPPDSSRPVGRVLLLLAVSAGPAGLLLSSTAPLLQRWFSQLETGRSPYSLYALSNAGSLAGLVAYSFVFERHWTVADHAFRWGLGFSLFCILLAAAALRAPSAGSAPTLEETSLAPASGWWRGPAIWFGLAAAPSMLLSATNNQIGQNVAPVPFLWVLTLGVYLLSFVLCFGAGRWPRAVAYPPLGLAFLLVCYLLTRPFRVPIVVQITIYAFALLACCLACHGELARAKPGPHRLTGFYLATACGGLFGGAFVALAAPVIFSGIWEFPIAILLCAVLALTAVQAERGSFVHAWPYPIGAGLIVLAVLLPAVAGEINWSPAVFVATLVAVSLFGTLSSPVRPFAHPRTAFSLLCSAAAIASAATVFAGTIQNFGRQVIFSSRNFYGVLRVTEAPPDEEPSRSLVLGRNPQGFQYRNPARRREPTGVYAPGSGIALTLAHHLRRPQPLRIGVLGLGAGAVAVWGRPGDTMSFYEINPEVIRVSAGLRPLFTFLEETSARIEIVEGDARLSLERARAKQGEPFDVLVGDVSGGGWIPPHLLTLEAFAVYRSCLRPDGVLALHIDNVYFDFVPLVRRQANEMGWPAARLGKPGTWMVLAREAAFLRIPAVAAAILPDGAPPADRAWTDGYSSLFELRRR